MGDAKKITALKTDVYKKAHSALLMCLDNKVLREVNKEDLAMGVWLKLETTLLYGRESLTLKDVLSALNSQELKKRTNAKDDGDGLFVRGQGSSMHSKGYDNGDLLMAMSEEMFLE
ncbi:hypothetical protein Tco_0631250 [Tanacetum coccineum]